MACGKPEHESSPMASTAPSMRLTGALSLRDGELQTRSVAIEDGAFGKGPLPEVDPRA